MAGELVEQNLHPHRHTQHTFGDQLRRRGRGDRSRTVRAGARPLITSPSDASAIGSNLDLDLFGILGVAGRERRAALRAHTLVFGQLAEILDHGQVAVVSPFRTGPILLLAPLAWRGVTPIFTLAFEVIRAIPGRGFFALASEQLILELSVLTAKIFNLGFEVLGPMHGPSVLSFPIPDLLPQFESSHAAVRQLPDAAQELRDEVAAPVRDKSAGSSRRKWFNKCVFHDTDRL